MLCDNWALHFGKCIVSRCVTLCPARFYVSVLVCHPHGPSSLLLLPSPLSPSSIALLSPVFLQAETETRRSRRPQVRMKSRYSPASLQQRIAGIHSAVRSLETWTSSRCLPWRDKWSLEKEKRIHNLAFKCWLVLPPWTPWPSTSWLFLVVLL